MMFDRNFKRMPEQHVKKLNDLAKRRSAEDTSNWQFNEDNSQVIVVGMQPAPSDPGTFGIRLYNVFGDRLELVTVVL